MICVPFHFWCVIFIIVIDFRRFRSSAPSSPHRSLPNIRGLPAGIINFERNPPSHEEPSDLHEKIEDFGRRIHLKWSKSSVDEDTEKSFVCRIPWQHQSRNHLENIFTWRLLSFRIFISSLFLVHFLPISFNWNWLLHRCYFVRETLSCLHVKSESREKNVRAKRIKYSVSQSEEIMNEAPWSPWWEWVKRWPPRFPFRERSLPQYHLIELQRRIGHAHDYSAFCAGADVRDDQREFVVEGDKYIMLITASMYISWSISSRRPEWCRLNSTMSER